MQQKFYFTVKAKDKSLTKFNAKDVLICAIDENEAREKALHFYPNKTNNDLKAKRT